MRLFRVEYSDFSFSQHRHVTDAWVGPVCTEIKGMLESMGCQKCVIIPDSGQTDHGSRSRLYQQMLSRNGSKGSGKPKAGIDYHIPY